MRGHKEKVTAQDSHQSRPCRHLGPGILRLQSHEKLISDLCKPVSLWTEPTGITQFACQGWLHLSSPGLLDIWSHIFSQIVLNRKTFFLLSKYIKIIQKIQFYKIKWVSPPRLHRTGNVLRIACWATFQILVKENVIILV